MLIIVYLHVNRLGQGRYPWPDSMTRFIRTCLHITRSDVPSNRHNRNIVNDNNNTFRFDFSFPEHDDADNDVVEIAPVTEHNNEDNESVDNASRDFDIEAVLDFVQQMEDKQLELQQSKSSFDNNNNHIHSDQITTSVDSITEDIETAHNHNNDNEHRDPS